MYTYLLISFVVYALGVICTLAYFCAYRPRESHRLVWERLPTGSSVTSRDSLRTAVTMLDRAITTGRTPDGHSAYMAQVGGLADAFAQQQTGLDEVLLQLTRVEADLLAEFPLGYWALAGALMCEIAHCRETAQFVNTCGPANDF